MSYLLDYAWAQIPAAAIRRAGYIGVMRYLGGSASLTPQERDNLFGAGLGIGLVWETQADEAEHPERGATDARMANEQASALGFPPGCPIFFADDRNDPDVEQELGYFSGVFSNSGRPVGVYSGGNVIKAVMEAGFASFGWMVETWFPDAGASPHLIQLANSKEPYIDGVSPDQYDSNVLIKPFPLWGITGEQQDPQLNYLEDSDMLSVTYNGVTYHVWAHAGRVLYRAFHSGEPQTIIEIPGDYAVDMHNPKGLVVGPFIYFPTADGKEVMFSPSAYGLVAKVV